MTARSQVPAALTGRMLLLLAALVVVAISALYVLLPALAGLKHTWSRISEGDVLWLLAAPGLEALSFVSYVVAFRAVFEGGSIRISWRDSYRITMAGVAATRLLATAGAGGVVLTVWALDRAGMPRRGAGGHFPGSSLRPVYVCAGGWRNWALDRHPPGPGVICPHAARRCSVPP